MRDMLQDLFRNETADPMEAARRAMRPPLRRRFYAAVTVAEAEPASHAVRLDGRPVLTPARRPLAAPSPALAQALAAEWAAQQDTVDPATMPLTRLANTVIDGVADAREPVAAEVRKYLGSDLLFYRAAEPAGLVAAQARHWDPVLAWADEAFGARFMLAEGVMHVAQPERALEALGRAVPAGPWRLGAVHAVTTLTGSALLALALAHGRGADAVWDAAHVDEDWNLAQWGRDELALQRRAFRRSEFDAAATVLALLPGG